MNKTEYIYNSCRSGFLQRINNLVIKINRMAIQQISAPQSSIDWKPSFLGGTELHLDFNQTYSVGEKFIRKRIV